MMLDTTMKGRSCFFAAVFAAIVCMALPSFAVTPVFETTTGDSGVYAFGSALSGETPKDEIGS